MTAAIARAVGTGLALALPAAAIVVLGTFSPLTLDPGGNSGLWVPITLGVLAVVAALAVVPLLWSLVVRGSVTAGAAAMGLTALTAGSAALALRGPAASASFPDSGLALTLVVAGVGILAAALTRERTIENERARWLAVIVVLVLAEAALAAAILAPGSALDDATAGILVLGAALGAAAAAVWLTGRHRVPALAAAAMALAAVLLAWARPGTVDALVALAPLVLTPPLLVAGLFERGESTDGVGEIAPPRVEELPTPGAPPPTAPVPASAARADADAAERDRLGRELRAALAELTDARHTIGLQRAELERAAEVDALTGVSSRSAIMERLRDEVSAARRYPHPVSIVLIDIDGMGALNAAHGTAVGDAVLRELALRMRVRVREADAIGRVAGDAFLAILPHTDENGATVFAEAIRDRATHRPIPTGQGEVSVTVSIGMTTMRARQDLTADMLLARADEAVTSARAAGGNVIAYDRLHGLARLEERHPEADDEPRSHRTDEA